MKTYSLVLLLVAATQAVPSSRFSSISSPVHKNGVAPHAPGSRIIHGTAAQKGQFPHQAKIVVDGSTFCGGSLISADWVLTSAACVYGGTQFRVSLGVRDQTASETGQLHLTSPWATIHPDFNSRTLANDIAVIRLPYAVGFTDLIEPTKLPSRSEQSNDFSGLTARISGWGRTSDASSALSDNLMYADLTAMTNVACKEVYGSAVVTTSILCASSSAGRGACNGDIGGPLGVMDQEYWHFKQIGIASFVPTAGCESGQPSGYTRITSYLDWLQDTTNIVIG